MTKFNALLKNNYINFAVIATLCYCTVILLDPKPKEVQEQIIEPTTAKEIEVLKPPQVDKPLNVEIKQPVVQAEVEVDQYSPRWNVEGSIKKAEDKADLIKHLSGSNHGYSVDYLNQLSVDDLQRLHDSGHDSRKSITYTRPRFRLFRR